MQFEPLQVPVRTIMTPGPVEADPRVLQAMTNPIVGQFDPFFTETMNDVMAMIREVYQTKNRWAFPVDGTSRAGTEAILASIIEEGTHVLVPIFGRFGHLLVEICERYGAVVDTLEVPWGQVFDQQVIIDEIQRLQPDVVALVHGETSTGCMQPLNLIGPACRQYDALFVVDAVATVGGVSVLTDEWCIDALIGGTQKCLSIPSGMAPITYNERVEAVIQQRKKVEYGVATEAEFNVSNPRRIRSNYFDLAMLQDYWSERRLNHHTEATSMLYALREGLRFVLEEGLYERFGRHQYHEKALMVGLEAMGLTLYGDPNVKLPTVTCVNIPEGVDGEAVRAFMLNEYGVEIASSFGPLVGKIWRIGTMGYSCRKENVLAVLSALESALIQQRAPIQIGKAAAAALAYYGVEPKVAEPLPQR